MFCGCHSDFCSTLLFVSSAEAQTASYNDPRPCSSSVDDGICISWLSVQYSIGRISLTMTVGKASHPKTDPNWQGSDLTNVSWNIFVNKSTAPTYQAIAADVLIGASGSPVSSGELSGGIWNLPDKGYTCDGNTDSVEASYDLSANIYDITFPASCVGTPSTLSVQALWSYDTTEGTGVPRIVSSPDGKDAACCSVSSDPATSTRSSTRTSTTQAPVIATGATPITAVQLAFTGLGQALRVMTLLSGALFLLGLLMLITLPGSRLLRRLAHRLSSAATETQRIGTRTISDSARTKRSGSVSWRD